MHLLGDRSPQVAEAVRSQLLRAGEGVRPYLEAALQHPDSAVREEARALLLEVAREEVLTQFRAFAAGRVDLEAGAFLLARLAYPDLSVADYRRRLDRTDR